MARSQERLVAACEVVIDVDGRRIPAMTQDVGPTGIFARTEELLPEGTSVQVLVRFPNRTTITTPGRVVHVLSAEAGQALGRPAGMGIELLADDSVREVVRRFLDDLTVRLTPAPDEQPESERVLVVDDNARFRDRMASALVNTGFEVVHATSAASAFVECVARPPDLVVVSAEMPDVDGWTLVSMLSGQRELVGVPVILLAQDADDLTRLRAYRLGVAEIIPKPFTVAELCIRARRLIRTRRTSGERIVLRGNIAEIAIGTLLSLFEVERKTGVLTLLRETEVAWIAVSRGRIARVDTLGAHGDRHQALGHVLDWTAGEFEFAVCEVYASDDGLSITRALLEHARLRDEGIR